MAQKTIQGITPVQDINANFDELYTAGAGNTASTTAKGPVELATSAETITGTDAERAVTPAGLAALTTSATRSGLVELATDAEAIAGTDTARAVTPANLAAQQAKIVDWTFVGAAAAGACTLTGAAVGDKVLSVTGLASGTAGNQAAKFESTITVINQIQQTDAGNLSANVYLVRLEHVA